MLNQVNEVLEMIVDDEKMLPNVAKIMKRLFDELIKQGFTEEQAAQIVVNFKATGQ